MPEVLNRASRSESARRVASTRTYYNYWILDASLRKSRFDPLKDLRE